MTNIERHGFDNKAASTVYSLSYGFGPTPTWGNQVWLDYCEWLCEDDGSGASNKVNHPKHYRHKSGLDAIVWIDRYSMNFATGNAFKYIFRRGEKAGETTTDDEEKAKWYFVHEANRLCNGLLTWDEAKNKVASVLINAFGPPGRKQDENGNAVEDWSKGGCDIPEAIDFIKKECMSLLKDGTKAA